MADAPDIVAPDAIEAESFRIIDAEAGNHGFAPDEWPLVRRAVHATADFDFVRILRFSPQAVAQGCASLRAGAGIYCDTAMVAAGVNKPRLARFGSRLHCLVGDPQVATAAQALGVTRSLVAMRAGVAAGCRIFLVGNAPTALFELLRLCRAQQLRPDLIIGVPVGFVGAAESKEALRASGLPHIVSCGRKGGSAVAAALFNALMLLAEEEA